MTNEEVMQLMTDMGLHDGGMENWIPDNAWYLVVNKAIEKEREACAKLVENRWLNSANCTTEQVYEMLKKTIAMDIRARGQA